MKTTQKATAKTTENALPFLSSTNFWTTVVTLVMGAITANGITLGLTPDELVNGVMGKSTIEIAIMLGVNLFNPALKIIKKIQAGEWSFEFIHGANFQAQAGSLLFLIIGYYMDAMAAGLVMAALTSLWNLAKHFIKNKVGSK